MRYEESGPIKDKAMSFSIRIYKLAKYLQEKNEYVLSQQVLKAGTSVGANAAESRRAESSADFCHKLEIASKECEEIRYWLELLWKVELIQDNLYNSLEDQASELHRLIKASVNTAKNNRK